MVSRRTRGNPAWICCLVLLLLLVGLTPVQVYAEKDPTVAESLENPASSPASGQTGEGFPAETPVIPGSEQSSIWMLLMQIVFSLGLVIILIFLLLRFLANKQIGLAAQSGLFKVIGTLPLGSGKTLHLVMIGDSLYLLGVGENVQLLRHIPAGDEMDAILAEAEIKQTASSRLADWLSHFRRENKQEARVDTEDGNASFEEMLMRQWDELNRSQRNQSPWNRDDP